MFEANQIQNTYLFDGDTISLGKAKEAPEEAAQLASVNLVQQDFKVNVIGEVKKPGSILHEFNSPLVQAVFATGGPKA